MAVKTGRITDIKLGSWLTGSVNAFDICIITIQEATTGSWAMFLWNSRADAPVLDRVLHTQRLALAREAAFRKLTVEVTHESDSSIIDHIKIFIP